MSSALTEIWLPALQNFYIYLDLSSQQWSMIPWVGCALLRLAAARCCAGLHLTLPVLLQLCNNGVTSAGGLLQLPLDTTKRLLRRSYLVGCFISKNTH